MQDTQRRVNYDTPTPPKRPANVKWAELYKSDYADITSRLAAVGFTESDIASTLGVPLVALRSWKKTFPDFKTAWKGGKRNQLCRMAAKAMLEAFGYDYVTTKTETTEDAEGNAKTKTTTFTNHQALQPNMAIFLLCNLSAQLGLDDTENWRSRQKMEIESHNVSLTITGEAVAGQIERLAGKLLGNQSGPQLAAEGPQLATGTLSGPPRIIDAQFEPEDKE